MRKIGEMEMILKRPKIKFHKFLIIFIQWEKVLEEIYDERRESLKEKIVANN